MIGDEAARSVGAQARRRDSTGFELYSLITGKPGSRGEGRGREMEGRLGERLLQSPSWR